MDTKVHTGRKITFKPYDQNQFVRVPIQIEEFIAPGHLARIIDGLVEQINMESLEAYYPGGGSSAYHPKMMIKVWLYGYCTRVYTTRPLARAVREQLPFIWLAGGQQPNFKTLSEFRGNRMLGMIDVIFKRVLLLLVEEGYISLEDLYVGRVEMGGQRQSAQGGVGEENRALEGCGVGPHRGVDGPSGANAGGRGFALWQSGSGTAGRGQAGASRAEQ